VDGPDRTQLREHGRVAGVLVEMRIIKRRVRSICPFCGRKKVGRHCRPCNRFFRNAQIQIERMMEPLRKDMEHKEPPCPTT